MIRSMSKLLEYLKIVLDEWLKRDYGNLESWALPDKYHKIIDAWKLLDLKAEKNYYKK